ncbi:hypothetical protein GOB40_13790 [Sinorhizobium meliloti]|nr:hypothetical protein [Sinorhizobium meliloti]
MTMAQIHEAQRTVDAPCLSRPRVAKPKTPAAQIEIMAISEELYADIVAWREEWLRENDPRDGTDCVTPFDKYLYKRQPVAEQQVGDPIWKTMDSAPTEPGVEIIAARFGIYDELTSMCEKSPFISFWMQTRRKFYGEPTHWLCKVPLIFPPISPTAAP